MINAKISEDIPGEAYILSSNANARAFVNKKIFYWFYCSRRNKAQFDTLYVSKQIDTDLFTLSIAKYLRFNNFLHKRPPLLSPFLLFDVIADKVHIH